MKTKFSKNVLWFCGLLAVLLLIAFWVWRNQTTSLIYLEEISLGQTGSEVCYERGMSCLSVSTARIIDSEGEFYGFNTPSCDSQVIEDPECVASFGTEYAIDNVTYVKSPNATSNEHLTSDTFCITSNGGKSGIYRHAYCVKN